MGLPFVASPLDTVAADIFNAFSGVFYDAVLVRASTTGSSPDIAFDPPDPTETEYTCKALRTKYSAMLSKEGVIDVNDRKVLILATSISVTPKPPDRVTIQGTTFTLTEVDIDPANAVWVCRGRF